MTATEPFVMRLGRVQMRRSVDSLFERVQVREWSDGRLEYYQGGPTNLPNPVCWLPLARFYLAHVVWNTHG